MIHLKYRPDIDGLRAVAVLSVVFCHAFPTILPGGFCGVDIFFVISGYLISGILFQGHREDLFSFQEFYARRIKRLFPSLIVVLLLTLGLGYRLLLSNEYEQLGKHIAAGALFIQNIVFCQESGYFDLAAINKPLLHLWSLAVEEQFYITFPLLLLLLWKTEWPVALVMGLLLATSFILNLVMSFQAREADFFLTPYRAWEFLAGSLLAWSNFERSHQKIHSLRFCNGTSAIGLTLIIAAMIFVQREQPYPGWRALIPVIGTLLFIGGGKEAWLNKWILSHQAIVWIGLISYPLYLFHWPLLSFLNIVEGGHPALSEVVLSLITSFLLASGCYYFVEKKIRFASSRATVPVLIVLFLGVGGVGALVWKNEFEPRSSKMGFDAYVEASQDNDYFMGFKRIPMDDNYTLSSAGGTGPKTLFIGDSHMEQCAPRILKLIQSNEIGNRGALFVTRRGTLPIPEVIDTRHDGPGFSEKILTQGLSNDVDRVVIEANWCPYFNWGGKFNLLHGHMLCSDEGSKEALLALEKMMTQLHRQGKQVYLILNAPTYGGADPIRMIKRSLVGNFQISPSAQSVKEFNRIRGFMNYTQGELMNKLAIAAQHAGAEVINPMEHIAQDGEFPRFDEGKPIYHDGDHLTATYIRNHASYLDGTILP